MNQKKLSLKEIEELDWYNLMTYIGMPFFSIGGVDSMFQVAAVSKIDRSKKVLIVGCGTGYSACLFAKKFGCQIVGIDIANVSIEEAKKRAIREKCEENTTFLVANANNMNFEDHSFDIVITMMVSMFLEKEKAYKEMYRVLKPGGCFVLNEMFKDDATPEEPLAKIRHAEAIYSDVVKFQFNIHSLSEWKQWLEFANLTDIELHQYKDFLTAKKMWSFFRSIGALNYFAIIVRLLKLMILSKALRKKFAIVSKVKKVIVQQKATRQYLGYVIAIGYKSS